MEPQKSSPRFFSQAQTIAAVWLASLILVTLCYYQTNISFLRAESGWYQFVGHSLPPPHYHMMRYFFTNSLSGHYTPLAFYGEFELTYLIGPREAFWKWRQLGILSLLGASLYGLAFSVARIHVIPRGRSMALAGGLSAVFIFQPLMRELVAWPLMAMQIIAAILSTLALFALVRWAKEPDRKSYIYWAVALSYLSMHCIGYGLVTVLATTMIISLCLAGAHFGWLPQFAAARRTLLVSLTTLLLLAGTHAACMYFLRPDATPLLPPSLDQSKSAIGFGLIAFVSVIRALFWIDSPPSFTKELLPSPWLWGLLFLIVMLSLLIGLARAYLRNPTADRLTRFILHFFSLSAFAGFIFMMVARYLTEPDSTNLQSFLFGSRYIVPINLMLFGSFTAIAVMIAQRAKNFGALLFLLLGITAFFASEEFSPTKYQSIYPNATISHGKAWRALVSLSRECRAANLPTPNVPMGTLTMEFYDWNLKIYEPLLRYSLHLAPQEKIEFEPWEKISGEERKKYEAVAPSLRQVIAQLKLP